MLETERSANTEGIGAFELCTEGSTPRTIRCFTISGGEPTLARAHLFAVLQDFFRRTSSRRFLLQTNGFVLGADQSYLDDLSRYREQLDIRISIKAGSPEGLLHRTGADPQAFDLPFKALEQAIACGFCVHVASMSDASVMPESEREALLARLSSICSSQGKRLTLYDDTNALGREGRAMTAESHSDLMLDEEVYVPYFPQIFAHTLGNGRPPGKEGNNA